MSAAEILFVLIIVLIVGDYLLERILDYLNTKHMSAELPDELQGIYDADSYRKSQEYQKEKQRFGMLTSTFSFILILVMLFADGFALLDQLVREITGNQVLMAVLFFGILGLAADILSTPFSVYHTFVIEEKYGFNKTGPVTFVTDKLKGWLIGGLIGGGILALITWIYTLSEEWFWLIAWGAIAVFTIFMSMFYSNIIVPLFNKQRPLEEGELRGAIEDFADKVGFKLKDIYVIDGSKRSSKANAYFTGLGPKKRIVLFDTLIEKHSVEELTAILAHEIGHYKLKHTREGLILSLLQMGVMLFVLNLFISSPALSEALGAESSSFHMGILTFGLLYSPISLLIGLLMNARSRKNEYAADRFAGKRYDPDALMLALKKLSTDHLSNLQPHPAYVKFYYSHPPLLQRLKALRRMNA